MKTASYVAIVLMVAVVFFFIGSTQSQEPQSFNDRNDKLEQAVQNMPRGGLDIPAQWFMMESMVGWEKMMLIFGYADNRDVCYKLVEMAREESPNRNFRCQDAN